ncbi:DUF4153 domain-containing protein [Oceanobacillus alkalisoli]|uniref:DUF4153 domain-containing protein n=1 Tax=Oceanobacillus alkalisoli TaxID=2925113 RepID=UPI001EE3EE15|nr:DUF4173 domain-containing protein [Oceanobacillus alkalisoli]MCG5104907.1 DUF4173 domain-containing protein [Oceanobacillus alkalisoli]
MRTKQREWLFLLTCLFLGFLANISFLYGEIEVSYIIFIAFFYTVLFVRFKFSFEHRRIGLLLMAGIWLLAGSFLLFDSTIFYPLNLLVIPAVVFFHIVLITSPAKLNWGKLSFIRLVTGKLADALRYLTNYLRYIGRIMARSRRRVKNRTLRQILLGILLTIPILIIIVPLLMSADAVFQEQIENLFIFRINVNLVEVGFRLAFTVVAAIFFFCIFQVIGKKTKREIEIPETPNKKTLPGIVAATILMLLNTLYVLFIALQFQYFFHEGLLDGFTYADYARRGFFELILVTLINWTILLVFMKRVRPEDDKQKRLLQILYSIMIFASGILLVSAWQRLTLYEAAYGFTMDRLLAHYFMAFLLVIFAYTLIRVWLENLPILHFYLICAFLFYCLLNAVNLEETIVENNLERYEVTGKIDIHYFSNLGAEGIKGLVQLYEKDPEIPGLKGLLIDKKVQLENGEGESWQAFNFARDEAKELLEELGL